MIQVRHRYLPPEWNAVEATGEAAELDVLDIAGVEGFAEAP